MSKIKINTEYHFPTKTMKGKGIQFVFDNGVVASIQIGSGNYCTQIKEEMDETFHSVAETCEIACWNSSGKWITSEYDSSLCDDVKGHVSTEEIPAFLEWCKNYKF